MFQNREQAAQLLSEKLIRFKGKDRLVFAIPRGAVVMGKIIAQALSAPFDVLVVRKIGAPFNPELAIGALAPGNTVYWDSRLCRQLHITKEMKNEKVKSKNEERREREKLLRGNKRYPGIKNKTIIVVDDGVATGATSIAAAKFIKKRKARKAILATPVIATDTLPRVKRYFDEVIYLEASDEFSAVGQFYEEFPQVEDEEVIQQLATSN